MPHINVIASWYGGQRCFPPMLIKRIGRTITDGKVRFKRHWWKVYNGEGGPWIHWRGDPRNGHPTD